MQLQCSNALHRSIPCIIEKPKLYCIEKVTSRDENILLTTAYKISCPIQRQRYFLSCAAYTAAPVILKMSVRDATTMSTHLASASDDDDEQFVFVN